MMKKVKADVFALSRGGLTVIASFAATPVISSDRINKARDERVRRARAARRDQARHDNGRPHGLPQAA